jgi:large subunit ribosomal protein L22
LRCRPRVLAQAHRLDVKKTLQSAIANAENNHDLDVDALVVAEAFVGKSIVMKRFHARGRGRASRIEAVFPPHDRRS